MNKEEIKILIEGVAVGLKEPIQQEVRLTVNGKIDKLRAENQEFHEHRIQQYSAIMSDIRKLQYAFESHCTEDTRWKVEDLKWKNQAEPVINGALSLKGSGKMLVMFLGGASVVIGSIVALIEFMKK